MCQHQHLETLHYNYNLILRKFIDLTTYFHVGFGSPTNNTSNPHTICMQKSNTIYLGALESPLDFAAKNSFRKLSIY